MILFFMILRCVIIIGSSYKYVSHSPYFQENFQGQGCVSVVECFHSMFQTPGSTPSSGETKQTNNNKNVNHQSLERKEKLALKIVLAK